MHISKYYNPLNYCLFFSDCRVIFPKREIFFKHLHSVALNACAGYNYSYYYFGTPIYGFYLYKKLDM